jgi:3-phenylpropionate/cinnamic acid dioxygenase small subunit
VDCNLLVYQARLEKTECFFVGRREDLLRRASSGWQIARRKIVLDQILLPRSISLFF